MYSERTADEILDDMLDSMRDDIDKREGSIAYDMQAPATQEIEMLGFELDAILELGWVDTSQSDYLTRKCAEMGIDRKPGERALGFATFTGDMGAVIPAGTIISTVDGLGFMTDLDANIDESKTATVGVTAVEIGTEYNVSQGLIEILPADLQGVESVTNADNIDGGVDEESDESLKERYYLKVRKPITSGNIYHYRLWATEVPGISNAVVHPTWKGPGTVKVVLIGDDGRAPDPSIVDDVVTHIDENAPIGADVTVVPITEMALDISVTLTLDGDLLPDDVQAQAEQAIANYLAITADDGVVRYVQVANALLDTPGVIDLAELTVNGGMSNIAIPADTIAVVGTVTLV